ncbi:MAG: hypothetical protein VXY41_05430 [Pseudomonadota bacterium]|nr:hypothetical protein [Pseudomonadota bacterium]
MIYPQNEPEHVCPEEKIRHETTKPRQHRKKFKKRQERERNARAIDDVKSEEFEAGYKAFLKEEFDG